MLQAVTSWTTNGAGVITPQPEAGHPNAVLLRSADPNVFDQFDAPRFSNPGNLLVSLTFRGGYHAVYFIVSTSRGEREFKFTPDRTPLTNVNGYRYAFGMGTRAKNGYWHTFEYDLGVMAAQAEPGIVINEITAHFVRFKGTLVASPAQNRRGADPVTSWSTTAGGTVTAQPERGHADAALLATGVPTAYETFHSAPFESPEDLLVSLTFRGGYHAVYFEVATSRGQRQFKFTPDRKPLTNVDGYRYAFGMGTRAKNGYWHTFEYDLGLMAAEAEPGTVVNEITAHYVRFAGTLVAAPALNEPGAEIPDTPTPTPTPTDPGPDPGGPTTRAEAARFLLQATFGPTEESIDELMALGNYGAWITRQFNYPVSETLPYTLANSNGSLRTTRHEVWWGNAMEQPDQLRQRVAFALSEIFVVSDNDYVLSNNQYAMCDYYDMLARAVTGNFRTLLTDVTLHPVMGIYLSMLRNQRANPALNIRPDENYARELLQLFTIGLHELDESGRQRLSGGSPIPTYNQTTIEEFARVFTGWNYNGVSSFTSNNIPNAAWLQPMWPVDSFHDSGAKQLLNGVTLPAGQTTRTDLNQALDNVFAHSNVGPFVGRLLIQRLVTSNPSPAYVRRVAAAFNNNGSGVRGDIAATVRAILLDPEARNTAAARSSSSFGKAKEPLLRLSNLWRAMQARPGVGDRGVYRSPTGSLQALSDDYGQTPLTSPSVFNFFLPTYSPNGSELVAPEMQILTEANLAATNNDLASQVYTYSHPSDSYAPVTRIYVDREIALASNPGALADHLNELLLAGAMTSTTRSVIVNHLNSIPLGGEGARTRALDAIFLCVASPAFQIQK